jgi:hypothetical protein
VIRLIKFPLEGSCPSRGALASSVARRLRFVYYELREPEVIGSSVALVSQLVFSGGAFLHKTPTIARSSYANAVYHSPACRFGENFIFLGGRKRRLPEGGN